MVGRPSSFAFTNRIGHHHSTKSWRRWETFSTQTLMFSWHKVQVTSTVLRALHTHTHTHRHTHRHIHRHIHRHTDTYTEHTAVVSNPQIVFCADDFLTLFKQQDISQTTTGMALIYPHYVHVVVEVSRFQLSIFPAYVLAPTSCFPCVFCFVSCCFFLPTAPRPCHAVLGGMGRAPRENVGFHCLCMLRLCVYVRACVRTSVYLPRHQQVWTS